MYELSEPFNWVTQIHDGSCPVQQNAVIFATNKFSLFIMPITVENTASVSPNSLVPVNNRSASNI